MLEAVPLIIRGCASTDSGPMSMAHQIHSMTPCGMMMESMMGGGHSGHSDASVHDQVESYTDSQQAESGTPETDHAHSSSLDPK